jgi:mono/diheme cytochrome c family protein
MKYPNFLSVVIFLLSGVFFSNFNMQETWDVPEKYEKMENPIAKDDKEALAIGKILYNKHCRLCHGKKGLGDGPTASQLTSDPKDFTDPAFQRQSDGAIFYKAWTGRNEMPSFEKRIQEEEDMWSVVNYVRSLD